MNVYFLGSVVALAIYLQLNDNEWKWEASSSAAILAGIHYGRL